MKSKLNKNHLYRCIKKKQDAKTIIGPFMRNNKVIEGTAANILRKQYMSVFTKPMEDYQIHDPVEFFKVNNSCEDCDKERVHICSEDIENISYLKARP